VASSLLPKANEPNSRGFVQFTTLSQTNQDAFYWDPNADQALMMLLLCDSEEVVLIAREAFWNTANPP
jgi:hypothetical protein